MQIERCGLDLERVVPADLHSCCQPWCATNRLGCCITSKSQILFWKCSELQLRVLWSLSANMLVFRGAETANELDLSFVPSHLNYSVTVCLFCAAREERNPLEETFPLGAVPRDTAEIVCLQRPECSTWKPGSHQSAAGKYDDSLK